MKERILITGGNGFLGHHLLPLLNAAKIEYWAPKSKDLDILTSQNIGNECDHGADIWWAIRQYQPTAILHMAAKCGGILANKNSPADFLRDNTQMALNVYEAARTMKVPYVYSLGSVCAYPKYCPVPFKEDNIWNGAAEETNFPYAQAKRTLMMLGQTYRVQYGIKGAHLIPVNMYGPYDHFDLTNSHVIPALIRKFIDAKHTNAPEVKCWGTGNATREFLYAGDTAEVLVKAIASRFDNDLPINLGVGQDISIKNLTHLIKELTEYQGRVVFDGSVSDGQPKRLLDTSRAKELLDWEATTELQEGLKKTIDWYVKSDKDAR
jgi:GDP-L-fucose synthase